MFALIVVLLLIIAFAAFIHYGNITEYFSPDYPYTVSGRNTKNMSYDLRGDIPPTETFTGPWLQSDIYNPAYIEYNNSEFPLTSLVGSWAHQAYGNDIYNYDRGFNYIRPNGTPLFL